MAVITAAEYKSIATEFATGYDGQVGAKQNFFDAVYRIVLLNSLKPEVDLLSVFYNTYLVTTSTLQSTANLLPAVRALNNHVVIEGDVPSVDDYLVDNGTTIPQTWADLCEQAGFDISPDNVDPV